MKANGVLIVALDAGEWSVEAPADLPPRKNACIQYTVKGTSSIQTVMCLSKTLKSNELILEKSLPINLVYYKL
jgi:hypothetical protein